MSRMLDDEIRRYLDSLPTLCTGQAADLKIEDKTHGSQVWLSRITAADGGSTNPVEVEITDGHRWGDVETGTKLYRFYLKFALLESGYTGGGLD